MKFSIGDKVLLKKTGEEGVLIAFLGKDMLEVAVDKVHFPVFLDEVDHPYLKWFTDPKKPAPRKKSDEPIKTERKAPPRLARSIYLSFMPVYLEHEPEDIVSEFRIFLLNETPSAIRFNYQLRQSDGSTLFSHKGDLHPFGHIFLHNVTFEVMANQPRLAWEIAEAGVQKATAQTGVLRIRPQKLFSHLQELLESGTPSFTYVLTEDAAVNLQATKPEVLPQPVIGGSATNTASIPITNSDFTEVIDLHANVLLATDAEETYSSAEILYFQLAALEKHIDTAIVRGLQRIVVIHGVGTGVLREAVHGLLEKHAAILRISNEWEGNFGFGATIAYLA